MNIEIVEVATFKFAKKGSRILQAESLGSAVGIGLYDTVNKKGGIYTFMFPDSTQATTDLSQYPLLFADTGLRKFFIAAYEYGIILDLAKVVVCGGAHFLDIIGGFNLGEKNCRAIENWLQLAGVGVDLKDIGGIENRTLEVNFKTGIVRVICTDDATIQV